ncbi:hypothetical protein [Streptomyces ziwulingensis]|uniref:Uncharacterized protein n=1 Tax=Streptomyces ziwulingensis TaxID=1045501 RepID=A0ABP9C6B8_9ACTN
MESSELRRAVEAARATTPELGLRADEVVVVHHSDRVGLRRIDLDAAHFTDRVAAALRGESTVPGRAGA